MIKIDPVWAVLLLFLTVLSTIPYYDIYVTKKIYNFKQLHPFSFFQFFSGIYANNTT